MTGLREYFAQNDDRVATPRIPVMVNMTSASMSSKKTLKFEESSMHAGSLDPNIVPNRNFVNLDDDSDEDEDFQIPECNQEVYI